MRRSRTYSNRRAGVTAFEALRGTLLRFRDDLAIGDGTLNELHTRAEGLQLKSTGQQKREGKFTEFTA
jgi:hypothetical protein